LFTGLVIDALINPGGPDLKTVTVYCVYMSLITVASAIASFFRSWCFSIVSERISKNLSNDVFGSIVHKDVSFFDD